MKCIRTFPIHAIRTTIIMLLCGCHLTACATSQMILPEDIAQHLVIPSSIKLDNDALILGFPLVRDYTSLDADDITRRYLNNDDYTSCEIGYTMQTYNAKAYASIVAARNAQNFYLGTLYSYAEQYPTLLDKIQNKSITNDAFFKQYKKIKKEMISAIKEIDKQYRALVHNARILQSDFPLVCKTVAKYTSSENAFSLQILEKSHYSLYIKKQATKAQALVEANARHLQNVQDIHAFARLRSLAKKYQARYLYDLKLYREKYKTQQLAMNMWHAPNEAIVTNTQYILQLIIYEQMRARILLEELKAMYHKALDLMQKRAKTLGLAIPKDMP